MLDPVDRFRLTRGVWSSLRTGELDAERAVTSSFVFQRTPLPLPLWERVDRTSKAEGFYPRRETLIRLRVPRRHLLHKGRRKSAPLAPNKSRRRIDHRFLESKLLLAQEM